MLHVKTGMDGLYKNFHDMLHIVRDNENYGSLNNMDTAASK